MEVSGKLDTPAALPGNHCIGAWIRPRACLNAVAKRKILCSCHESNPVVRCLKNMKEINHVEGLGARGKIIIERILGK